MLVERLIQTQRTTPNDGSLFNTPHRTLSGNREGRYPEESGFQVAELPYRGNKLLMVLVAPMAHDGLGHVEQQLTSENLSKWLGQFQQRSMHVKLPKLKLATNVYAGRCQQSGYAATDGHGTCI